MLFLYGSLEITSSDPAAVQKYSNNAYYFDLAQLMVRNRSVFTPTIINAFQ